MNAQRLDDIGPGFLLCDESAVNSMRHAGRSESAPSVAEILAVLLHVFRKVFQVNLPVDFSEL
jgi:hypothetical protein